MTTVMGSSTSGSHHLISTPSRLPFPTSPSLPARRVKSKGSSTGLAGGERLAEGQGLHLTAPGRQTEITSQGQGSGRQLQVMNVTEEEKAITNVDSSANSNDRHSTVRRSHRNIVTSRRRIEQPSFSSLVTHSSLSITNDKNNKVRDKDIDDEDKKKISSLEGCGNTADPPPLPEGVFLTSLIFEESATHSRPARSPGACNEAPRTSTDVSSDTELCPSGRQGVQPSRTVATRNTFGLQRVYLEGLDYMRDHVAGVEKGVELTNRKFHKANTGLQDDWLLYLRECNGYLLEANATLLSSGVTLEVIDTETSLAALLERLRANTQSNKLLVEFLTRFRGELLSATQELQLLLDKFSSTVLHRISSNYVSSQISELQVPICQTYTSDINAFTQELKTQLTNTTFLLKNYENSVNKDLVTTTSFHDRLMLCCDLKAFPILGFVYDISARITLMCDTAKQWLQRDEQFMHDIHGFIRETRTATRKRQQVLHTEKSKQKKVERNVKVAYNILHSNREKLRLIEAELRELEQTLDLAREQQQARIVEIQHKESMMDFLKVTLQQTKKHCRLQTQRAKLHKQVKELSNYVKRMETDLELVQDQILAKSHEKIILTEKINTSEKSYVVLKTDFDRFSENLEHLETEVSGLSGQLLQLEIVHTIRTSPEILDNLTDRPTTVRLSRSLRERIRQRHQKSLPPNR